MLTENDRVTRAHIVSVSTLENEEGFAGCQMKVSIARMEKTVGLNVLPVVVIDVREYEIKRVLRCRGGGKGQHDMIHEFQKQRPGCFGHPKDQ